MEQKIKFSLIYGFGVFIFIFFLLSGIILLILKRVGYLDLVNKKLNELINLIVEVKNVDTVQCYNSPLTFGIYIIADVIFLITIYKILCNNEKYKKIKLMIE
ncbi:hypothetical protein MKS88_003976 [Plasmodium brasilianum]|uniref:Uncharacterized protein n=1 Tax=Plasmodium brasilianum TaxID=5824 RepID=A0ACB9Y8U7_PLABR|nr:hypothetical protein MKS88_003976 [Plasmodium brasilianum]